jgi:uncharacterized membrane protein (TIGR02234 family)
VLALLVVSGAVALTVGAHLTWWSQVHLDSLSGPVTSSAKGSQADPLLIPVALLALAGFGAALASTGVLRRLVGVVLLVGGGWAAVRAAISLWQSPASLHTDLSTPAVSSAPPQLHLAGPLVALFGGLLVALAGALVVRGFGARAALGARFDAPTSRAGGGAQVPTAPDASSDPEAAAGWWKALDAGQDPTAPTPDCTDPGVSGDIARGV